MNAISSTKVVPLPSGEIDVTTLRPKTRGEAHAERETAELEALNGKVDGRHLRRKGRTQTLSTKVKPETMATLHRIVQAHGMTMVEAIETAVAMLDRHLKGSK